MTAAEKKWRHVDRLATLIAEDLNIPRRSGEPDYVAAKILEALEADGLVLVPREPTAKMIEAAGGAVVNLERADDQSYSPAEIYSDMIGAAE